MLVGAQVIPCALGRSGMTRRKREGDGATPIGAFAFTGGQFRLDRIPRLNCSVPLAPIRPASGWCDDSSSPNYNRSVKLPSRHRHETLFRNDELYDMLFVIDYNARPRIAGAGSAIFFHVATADLSATEGCVAIRIADMRRLAPRLTRRTILEIR